MVSGQLWSEVCDLEALEIEVSKIRPMTGADIADVDEARRFHNVDRRNRSNIFETDHGRRVAEGDGCFRIMSGGDAYVCTFATTEMLATMGS